MDEARQQGQFGMNVIVPPDQAPQTPPFDSPRRFTWRTIVVPVLFVGIHLVFSVLVVLIYTFVYAAIQAASGGPDIMTFLMDTAAVSAMNSVHFPVIACLIAACLIPVFLVYLRLAGRRDTRVWLTGKPRAGEMLAALAMMTGSLGLINIYFNLLLYLEKSNPLIESWMTAYEESAGSFTAELGYFWLILGVCILTPILEELIFRGVVQGELRKAMPEWAAIVIQAVVFAAYHMQPIQSSYVLLPGLLLGMAYYWSRSIWVPIAMHCVFNFIGSALPELIGDSELGQNILGYSEMAFILVGIAAGIYLFLSRRPDKAPDLAPTAEQQ